MTRRKGKRLESARRAMKVSQEMTHAVGTCPGCGKQAYTSRAAAKAAGRQVSPGVQLRVYACPDTDGRWWHQTSQSAERTALFRDTRVFGYGYGEVNVTRSDAERAREFTAAFVNGTGEGPTWRQLADAMGWPEWVLPALMPVLARGGWLTYTRKPRSLRPGLRTEETEP